MRFPHVARVRVQRAASSRHYKLPRSTPGDELKIKNLKQAGERFVEAFTRRSNAATPEE